jgi:hypothetical protein
MFEQQPDLEPSELRKGSPAITRMAHDTAAQDRLQPGQKAKAPPHGLAAVKPHLILHHANQDKQKPSENFANSQHGIFDIFQDHSVLVTAKKAQVVAAFEAKKKAVNPLVSSVIKRKTSLDQAETEQAAPTTKEPEELVKERTRASAATRMPAAVPAPAGAAIARRAVDSVTAETPAAAHEAPPRAATQSHADTRQIPGRSTIDYGGVFGDPFEDNAVDATAAGQAQPSWF